MNSSTDLLRQALNLLLSAGQIITTFLCFYIGTDFDLATQSKFGASPMTPAGYAFTIWSLIYALSLAYGIWQALPARRADPLLRRIGWSTAAAFAGTSAWLVAARLNQTWLTLACIIWLLVFLYRAWTPLWTTRAASNTERWLVRFHLAVFTGWVTVATFANFAAAMKGSGWADLWIPETAWCVSLLVLAGVLAVWAVRGSHADPWYTLTIIWALTAIVVSNATRFHNRPILVTAATLAALIAATWLFTRLAPGTRTPVLSATTSS